MNQALHIYNTLSGQKEKFTPLIDGFVGMYVCGPTVYSYAHLGNVRTFTSFDIVNRYLRHLGYKVRYVRNITDAGHLTDDDNPENDRFVKQSKLEQLEPMEIVQKYTLNFHEVLALYNLLPPDIEPTATGHIMEQIEIIQNLIEKDLAYEVNGSVYFDVFKYAQTENYGELSGRNIEDLMVNTRELEGQVEKKNPQDFALWKNAAPEHIMKWKSPWGEGFPGWHLECTAMSTKYLGDTFDIHGGGMDLKFPHHECEIAQAKGIHNGQTPVRYWMHTNMLTMNGQKMSKSLGNVVLPMELISGDNHLFEKGFHPSIIRFFMLQAHYRSQLDFSNDALLAAEKGYHRLFEALEVLKSVSFTEKSSFSVQDWKEALYTAMNDDFNTPMAIAQLFEGTKYIYALKEGRESLNKNDLQDFSSTLNRFIEDVLGLEKMHGESENEYLDQALQVLIALRNEARNQKNFALSDEIRDRLTEVGITLKDGKEGTSYDLK